MKTHSYWLPMTSMWMPSSGRSSVVSNTWSERRTMAVTRMTGMVVHTASSRTLWVEGSFRT